MATRNLAWPESILILDVHPSVGANPPGPTTAEPFAPEALYEIKIDTDDDAVADITFQVRFTPSEGGAQTATLRRLEGLRAAGTGEGGQVIVEGAPVSMGRETKAIWSPSFPTWGRLTQTDHQLRPVYSPEAPAK